MTSTTQLLLLALRGEVPISDLTSLMKGGFVKVNSKNKYELTAKGKLLMHSPAVCPRCHSHGHTAYTGSTSGKWDEFWCTSCKLKFQCQYTPARGGGNGVDTTTK